MALKRTSTESIFGVLTKDTNVEPVKEEKIKKQETEPAEDKKIEEKKEMNAETSAEVKPAVKEKTLNQNPAEDTGAEEASPEIKIEETAAEPAESAEEPVKAPSFIAKAHLEKKEVKSVRKQFVLTPTQAAWLKATAEANGISENKVIELLIKNAAEE